MEMLFTTVAVVLVLLGNSRLILHISVNEGHDQLGLQFAHTTTALPAQILLH